MSGDRGLEGRVERQSECLRDGRCPDACEVCDEVYLMDSWEDLTLELQADQNAEDRARREQDQHELDEQQTLDGEDRCIALD
jgi:ferredoxin